MEMESRTLGAAVRPQSLPQGQVPSTRSVLRQISCGAFSGKSFLVSRERSESVNRSEDRANTLGDCGLVRNPEPCRCADPAKDESREPERAQLDVELCGLFGGGEGDEC